MIEEWWPRLPERVRVEIAADPAAVLSTEAVLSIARVRGVGPVAAGFVSTNPTPPFELTAAEQAGIRERGQPGDAVEPEGGSD